MAATDLLYHIPDETPSDIGRRRTRERPFRRPWVLDPKNALAMRLKLPVLVAAAGGPATFRPAR